MNFSGFKNLTKYDYNLHLIVKYYVKYLLFWMEICSKFGDKKFGRKGFGRNGDSLNLSLAESSGHEDRRLVERHDTVVLHFTFGEIKIIFLL
jgi:hypothetical protein